MGPLYKEFVHEVPPIQSYGLIDYIADPRIELRPGHLTSDTKTATNLHFPS